MHHIHFWDQELEPKHIYYIGQSKHFEEWYNKRKNNQDTIYKDFEERSTSIKFNYKKTSYDAFSIH